MRTPRTRGIPIACPLAMNEEALFRDCPMSVSCEYAKRRRFAGWSFFMSRRQRRVIFMIGARRWLCKTIRFELSGYGH